MKKYEMARKISERMNCSISHAYDFLTAFKDVSIDALVSGDDVKIVGLGKLSAYKRKGREYHAITAEPVFKDDDFTVRWKVGKELYDALNT